MTKPTHPTDSPGGTMRFLMLPLALVFTNAALAGTGLLNDTGQTSCYDASNAAVACDSTGVGGDTGVNPRQDARFGRDAKAAAGTLTKIGGGAAGFDFFKICMNGDGAGYGACPSNPAANTGASPAATEWACTRDILTGLIWSLETVSNITWDDATATGEGSPIKAYNDAARCGYSDGWRVPTRRELLSIVLHGASSPTIDSNYFPATLTSTHWSSNIYAPDPTRAWVVFFSSGYASYANKTATEVVRLVRSADAS